MSLRPAIWTVGHSNHDFDRFVGLVLGARIEFLVDVRSYPYSRIAPHFNREELQPAIEECGVRYAFLGLALGGRPQREDHLDDEGHALYGEMAQEPAFKKAIRGLLKGADEHRIALMCSCGQPAGCHRRLMVGKVLCEEGVELRHILPDGNVETEQSVSLRGANGQPPLFGHDPVPWRSTRSVSRRRRLSASSAG